MKISRELREVIKAKYPTLSYSEARSLQGVQVLALIKKNKLGPKVRALKKLDAEVAKLRRVFTELGLHLGHSSNPEDWSFQYTQFPGRPVESSDVLRRVAELERDEAIEYLKGIGINWK